MIRDARPADRGAIVALTAAAFDGEEKALRIVREAEPAIELVWEEDGRIVGHVLLSRMLARLSSWDPAANGTVEFPPAFG